MKTGIGIEKIYQKYIHLKGVSTCVERVFVWTDKKDSPQIHVVAVEGRHHITKRKSILFQFQKHSRGPSFMQSLFLVNVLLIQYYINIVVLMLL